MLQSPCGLSCFHVTRQQESRDCQAGIVAAEQQPVPTHICHRHSESAWTHAVDSAKSHWIHCCWSGASAAAYGGYVRWWISPSRSGFPPSMSSLVTVADTQQTLADLSGDHVEEVKLQWQPCSRQWQGCPWRADQHACVARIGATTRRAGMPPHSESLTITFKPPTLYKPR